MSIINTSSFSSDLLPLVKKWFGDSYDKMPLYYDKMVAVEKTDRNYHVEAIMDTLGLLQRKNEGSALTYDTSKEVFKPTYQAVAYALGFIITKEAMDDGDAMLKAKRFTEQFKLGALNTRETIVANLYNNAFAASSVTMTNGDGKTMVASDHPVHGGTQSNLITGGSVDISEAALEQIRQDIRNMKNHRGLRIGAMPDKLICSVSDEAAANRILYSDKRVATADNDLNFLRANNTIPGGIVANPYLTDSDAFFVTTTVPNGPKLIVRQELEIDESGDFDTKNAKFSVMMRLVAGWSDWRGVVGSAGA
jgi:hypothetical protein